MVGRGRGAWSAPARGSCRSALGDEERQVVERLGLARWFSPSLRMALRNIQRRPVRSALTCLALALATAPANPVGNSGDRGMLANLARARVEYQQAELQLKSMEMQVTEQVRALSRELQAPPPPASQPPTATSPSRLTA